MRWLLVAATPTASGNAHAALFGSGRVIDLGTLGGLNSEAIGINKPGLIVGNSQIASGYVHAFLYSNNVMSDLGTLGGYRDQSLWGRDQARTWQQAGLVKQQ
jgi:probable HAF family extracellular repeat protein